MPQTKAGSDNNAWLKYMKERAKEFKAKQLNDERNKTFDSKWVLIA